MKRLSCKNCLQAKPLCFAVYCKKDPDLRDLPHSVGYAVGEPLIQAIAPNWCPLAPAIDTEPSSPIQP